MARLVPPIAYSSDADATAIADGSLLLRAVDRLFGVTAESWCLSTSRARFERILDGETRRGDHAVRLAGWMGVSAIITRTVIAGFEGLLDELASGLGWFAALPFAIACILWPGGVLVAWRQWRGRNSSGVTGSTGRGVDAPSGNHDDIGREPPNRPHPTQAFRPR